MATVFVLRRMPDGTLAMATFLIDIWCMGLKDAWGRLAMTMTEFEEIIERQSGLQFEEIGFSLANRLVVGSIHFARENGFRLPRRYDRWVALAGIGDQDEADSSDEIDLRDFRRDGCLVYMGSLHDLRKRLIGQSVEEFLERDDVQFAFGIDRDNVIGSSDELVDELLEWADTGRELPETDPADIEAAGRAEEEFEKGMEVYRKKVLDQVRRWCFSQRIEPHPKLEDAWDLQELALLQAPGETASDSEIQAMRSSIAGLLEMSPPEEREELIEALEQIRSYVSQFKSEDEMLTATGIVDPESQSVSDAETS